MTVFRRFPSVFGGHSVPPRLKFRSGFADVFDKFFVQLGIVGGEDFCEFRKSVLALKERLDFVFSSGVTLPTSFFAILFFDFIKRI